MSDGVILALCSAFVWGSGDFCGGRATARHDRFQVLGLSALAGLALLGAAALMTAEKSPSMAAVLWSAVAGLAGAAGIVALYSGLALGSSATVAPLAAVVAAASPVAYAAILQGVPKAGQVGGFALALVGIGLVSRSAAGSATSRAGVRLGALAGVGFGGFLILIAQVPHASVFLPLLTARAVMLAVAVVVMAIRRTRLFPARPHPMAFAAGFLDAGGNILYVLAEHTARIDIAGVLSSLYPVATVLLSRIILGERIAPSQWVGATACLVAILLITA
jgi:drug/metabolite transporter (DMT)-like permease